MAVYYDSIAEQYKKSKELPFRLYVEAHTYFNMIGNVIGKSFLDLGCGEGFYTRKFKQKGATQVVGVDVSKKMIELARQEEVKKKLGIEYIICDVLELDKIGSFDLVVASYLLCYAQSKEQLLKMCQNISFNLKPGGRFITITDNIQQDPKSYSLSKKYGFTKSISGSLREGTPITITYTTPGDREKFSFDDYYLSQAIYEWAFQSVGFKEIRWQKPIVSSEGIQKFGNEFWQDFINYPPIIGIECMK